MKVPLGHTRVLWGMWDVCSLKWVFFGPTLVLWGLNLFLLGPTRVLWDLKLFLLGPTWVLWDLNLFL